MFFEFPKNGFLGFYKHIKQEKCNIDNIKNHDWLITNNNWAPNQHM